MGPEGHKTCPDCGKPCTLVAEECYFFRLSAYEDRLLEFYAANPEFVRPQSRMNEVTSFVRQGLRDLSITRTTVKWGIPVPDDPKHTIYVWFDALHNYLTGIGYGSDEALFRKFWPADVHLMAKDILRFHAIFWPAFLMAAGFPLPKCVFSHGWWLKDNTKMSKSRGNVLDPNIILRTFGADALRYFLLREIPIGLDGNFSHEGFLHRVNSDLANDLGNLVQRTLTMVRNYFGGAIAGAAPATEDDERIRTGFDELKTKVHDLYDACALNRALEEVWAYLAVRQQIPGRQRAVEDGQGPREETAARAGPPPGIVRRPGRELSAVPRDAVLVREGLGISRRKPNHQGYRLCRPRFRRLRSGAAGRGAEGPVPQGPAQGFPGRGQARGRAGRTRIPQGEDHGRNTRSASRRPRPPPRPPPMSSPMKSS